MTAQLGNLTLDEALDEETKKKAIRIAKSIEKKFNELKKLGVSALLNQSGGVSFRYFHTSILNVAIAAGEIDNAGGFTHDYKYCDYEIYSSQLENII